MGHVSFVLFEARGRTSNKLLCPHFANARGYGDLKKEIVDVLVETLRPIRERYEELARDPAVVREVLRRGAEQLTPRARATADAAKRAMGVGS